MNVRTDAASEVEYDAGKLPQTPICPVDRLPSRRRNRICLRIICIGAVNFLAYTMVYALIGGDAPNGHRDVVRTPDGAPHSAYFVRGHFIRSLSGREREVSRSLWIYSYLHSISLPLTSGAMIVSMLVLARPHILATMRDGWLRGSTFVTGFAALVSVISVGVAFLFSWSFVAELAAG